MGIGVNAYKIRILEEIGNAYRDLFPERYEAAVRMVKEARERLIVPSGMSAGGTMRWSMRVPTDLFLFIRRYIPDFGDTDSDWDILLRTWPELRVGVSKRL